MATFGTTFIKLGQFLATRPDIIGEELAKSLEKLQDKVPAFDLHDAKKIIKKEIGENYFKDIQELSEPIAAASIAQVHLAKIKHEEQEKQVAIKILRPDIEKLFNEELDALMLFAYIVENTIAKAKRLKLVEVVHLLREITNIEMDLRFEAAAANELYENTKNDQGFIVPKIYWNYTTKKILTLDKVEGVSIRELQKLKDLGVDLKKLERTQEHLRKLEETRKPSMRGVRRFELARENIKKLEDTQENSRKLEDARQRLKHSWLKKTD